MIRKILVLNLLPALLLVSAAQAHTVQKGDTVYGIATKVFELEWSEVEESWRNKDNISPGDVIKETDLTGTEKRRQKQTERSRSVVRHSDPSPKLGEGEGSRPENYIVKEGEWLSTIGKKLDVDWREIAKLNGIEKPYTIYPGQKLKIPSQREVQSGNEVRIYRNVGANPYKGTWQKALSRFDIPAQIKNQLGNKIQNEDHNWYELGSGDKLSQINFGEGEIWNNVVCKWDDSQLYAAKEYVVGKYHLVQILKCQNWAWWAKRSEKVSKGKDGPEGRPPVFFVSKFQDGKQENGVYDLYIGAGNYKSVHYDASGYYGWAKARYRPFEATLSEKGSLRGRLGGFLFGSAGEGHDGDYDYNWHQAVIGPSAQILGSHWDADLEVGIGRLWNKGGEGLYESEQVDDILLFSAHGSFYERRDAGHKWFPKTELNVEYRHILDTDHEHSWDGNELEPDSWDNRNLEIMLTQGVYDFKPRKHLTLTPGLNLGFIQEYGTDSEFLKFGPEFRLRSHNEDILSLSLLNWKEQIDGGDADQWHPISGWISVGGVIKAYQASQITNPTAEDLGVSEASSSPPSSLRFSVDN